jgi:hypothetical protein
VKLKSNVAISENGFVFDPTTGDSYSLNPIGTEIIEMMKQDKSEEFIRDVLLEKYEIDKSNLERYFFDFVTMLREFQLLEENE